jgi:hypothetical protein
MKKEKFIGEEKIIEVLSACVLQFLFDLDYKDAGWVQHGAYLAFNWKRFRTVIRLRITRTPEAKQAYYNKIKKEIENNQEDINKTMIKIAF